MDAVGIRVLLPLIFNYMRFAREVGGISVVLSASLKERVTGLPDIYAKFLLILLGFLNPTESTMLYKGVNKIDWMLYSCVFYPHQY